MRVLLNIHLLVWAMGSPQRLPVGLVPMLEVGSSRFNGQPAAPPGQRRGCAVDHRRSAIGPPFLTRHSLRVERRLAIGHPP